MLDSGAAMPTRATDGSVGYDVKCVKLSLMHENGAETICETPDQIRNTLYNGRISYLKIDTGIHVTPEDGYYVELVPNSRQGKTSICWNASIGVIDVDYIGSIKILAATTLKEWNPDVVSKLLPGNVVGQLIIRPKIDAEWELTDKLDKTERGDGGFGSTAETCENCQHHYEQHIHGSTFHEGCSLDKTQPCSSFRRKIHE